MAGLQRWADNATKYNHLLKRNGLSKGLKLIYVWDTEQEDKAEVEIPLAEFMKMCRQLKLHVHTARDNEITQLSLRCFAYKGEMTKKVKLYLDIESQNYYYKYDAMSGAWRK